MQEFKVTERLDATQMLFRECDACAAKPGSPPLCHGCLNNREVIHQLSARVWPTVNDYTLHGDGLQDPIYSPTYPTALDSLLTVLGFVGVLLALAAALPPFWS